MARKKPEDRVGETYGTRTIVGVKRPTKSSHLFLAKCENCGETKGVSIKGLRSRACSCGSAWLEEENRVLRDHPNEDLDDLTRRLPRRTRVAIKNRRIVLGLPLLGKPRNLWSLVDDGILNQNKDRPWEDLLKLLPGRTKHSVNARLKRKGWARQRADTWTVEEDAQLRESSDLPLDEVATKLGRSYQSVSWRRHTIGLSDNHLWTEEEDKIIQRDWEASFDDLIEQLPGRARESINTRRHVLRKEAGLAVSNQHLDPNLRFEDLPTVTQQILCASLYGDGSFRRWGDAEGSWVLSSTMHTYT